MDIVALAGVISAGAVGFASVVASVVNGWFTREHDRRMAREARVYEARSRVYEEALIWAQRRQTVLLKALNPDTDALVRSPTQDEAGELRARIAAFGTQGVSEALKAYDQAVTDALDVARMIRAERTEGSLPAAAVFRFQSLNDALQEQLRTVEGLMRDELAQT